MNERIRQIAQQAGFKIVTDGRIIPTLDHNGECGRDLQEFAELIVKKFDDILLLQQLDCIGNHDKQSAELIEQIRDKTKTYFGVE